MAKSPKTCGIAGLGSWLRRAPAAYRSPLGEDPEGFRDNGGANMYQCCLDDPVDVIDPTGTKAAVLWNGKCVGGNHPVPASGSGVDNLGSLVSGMGDGLTTIPGTNICLTRSWREHLGAETLVDTNNGWYNGGQFAGEQVQGILIGEGAGTALKALQGLRAAREVEEVAQVNEGIYWFKSSNGQWYVGQSGDIDRRIAQHLASTMLDPVDIGTVRRAEVLGGKTTREIAEQLKIDSPQMGGVRNLRNIRNPIGNARLHLMPPGYTR